MPRRIWQNYWLLTALPSRLHSRDVAGSEACVPGAVSFSLALVAEAHEEVAEARGALHQLESQQDLLGMASCREESAGGCRAKARG